MDPLARPIRADRDCYYTLVSVADLPCDLGDIEPRTALRLVDRVSFGTGIGETRAHHLGLNSFDDLIAGATIPDDVCQFFGALIAAPHQLHLFHQLLFSAIGRLKRSEHALAVLDAQPAFESLVAVSVVENLAAEGKTGARIEAAMSTTPLNLLKGRLRKLDEIAAAIAPAGAVPAAFVGSAEHAKWKVDLYALRNRIVHEGLRDVQFAGVKSALVALAPCSNNEHSARLGAFEASRDQPRGGVRLRPGGPALGGS